MPEKDESTPNLRTQTKPENLWEEPLPLPDVDTKLGVEEPIQPPETQPSEVKPPEVKPPEIKPPEIGPPETKPQEIATPQVVSRQKEKISLKLTIKLALKKVAQFLMVAIFAVGVIVLILNFSNLKKLASNIKIDQIKNILKFTPEPKKAGFAKRISSAFVPKTPSKDPAPLFVNWKKVEASEGFTFYHPEEWQLVKDDDLPGYTLFYPVADSNLENFGETVFAKLAIFKTSKSKDQSVAEFLLKRYNLSNVEVKEEISQNLTTYSFKSDKIFVFAQTSAETIYILEGQVAEPANFENFFPIFENVAKSFSFS